jgi:hypothetical protein
LSDADGPRREGQVDGEQRVIPEEERHQGGEQRDRQERGKQAGGGSGADHAARKGEQEQRDAGEQQQVGRAEEGGDAGFDPEDLVPQQVTDPAQRERGHPDQAEAVAAGHRLGPGEVVGASGLHQP